MSQIKSKFNLTDNEMRDAVTCRFMLTVKDQTLDYEVDHAYMLPFDDMLTFMPMDDDDGFLYNSDFEIPIESPL